MSTHKIKLSPTEQEVEIDEFTSILERMRQQKVYIKSSCGGNGSCGDCVMRVMNGGENLSEVTFNEKRLLGNVYHITKERLCCQTRVFGNVEIDISAHNKSMEQKQRAQKNAPFNLGKTKVKKAADIPVSEPKEVKGKEDEDSWKKHWEKKDEEKKSSKGGRRRPKTFRTDD